MLAVVLPVSLLGLSLMIWRDEKSGTPFLQVFINNGVGLYVLGGFPACGMSALHTKILRERSNASIAYSSALGVIIGVLLAVLVLLVLFQSLVAEMWAILFWAASAGAIYGLLVGVFFRNTGE